MPDVAGPGTNPAIAPAPDRPPRQHIIDAARATAQTLSVKVASLAVYNPAGDVEGRGARFWTGYGYGDCRRRASQTSD